jgi:hypothetical protein
MMMPAFPVVQPAVVPPPLVGGLAPLPPLPAPPPLPTAPPFNAKSVPMPAPYKPPTGAKRQKVLILVCVGLGVLLAAGGAGYYFLFADSAVEEPVITQPVRPNAPRIPASSVEIAPLPPAPRPFDPPPSVAAEAPPVPTTPVPSIAFRSWVSDVRVSGVRSGQSTLAIINGRVARLGDMVDAAEGVVFEGVDDTRKVLIFRGRNGATLDKNY